VVDTPYLVTGLLIVTLPLGMIGGFSFGLFLTLWWLHACGAGAARYVLATVALFALYIGTFAVLYRDPLRVLYWYMD
jgi:hypothetical protein